MEEGERERERDLLAIGSLFNELQVARPNPGVKLHLSVLARN